MKYCMFVLSALLCSCGHYLPYYEDKPRNETVLIIVECKNEKQVETAALQTLRFVRINDLEKRSEGTSLFIKARYQALPDHKAFQIRDDLKLILGVLDIQIIKDGLPVKNIL